MISTTISQTDTNRLSSTKIGRKRTIDSTEKRSSVPRWWDARALSCSLFIARSPNLGCFWRQSGTLAPSA